MKEIAIEVPEHHKEIIRRRLKNLNPDNLHDWDEVKDKFTVRVKKGHPNTPKHKHTHRQHTL